jgi:hypothetical protein
MRKNNTAPRARANHPATNNTVIPFPAATKTGMFCSPRGCKSARDYMAHEVRSPYLAGEQIGVGEFAIVRLNVAAKNGDLACVNYGGRNLISRVYFTDLGVCVTDTDSRGRELPTGSFEIVGVVVDVCTGTPDCPHGKRPHPIAREAVTKASPRPAVRPKRRRAKVYDLKEWRALRRVHDAKLTRWIIERRGSAPKREARKPKGGAR